MQQWRFLRAQFRNYKGMLLVYIAIYSALLGLGVFFYLYPAEVPMEDRYLYSCFPADYCIAILGALPILFLSSELIASGKRPFLRTYGYTWGRRDCYLFQFLSILIPIAWNACMTLLYAPAFAGVEGDHRFLLLRFLGYCVEFFALSSLSLMLAMILKNILVTFLLMMLYGLGMLFLDVNEGMFYNVMLSRTELDFGSIGKLIFWMVIAVVCNEVSLRLWKRNHPDHSDHRNCGPFVPGQGR